MYLEIVYVNDIIPKAVIFLVHDKVYLRRKRPKTTVRSTDLKFHMEKDNFKSSRTSLAAQWLRIRLPMQGTRVRALVWEDPTCRGATKPVHHNY